MKKIFIALIVFILIFGGLPKYTSANSLSERLSGKILLQVQANGEAWYIYPVNNYRYYLGRPLDAFNIMRNLSLGISNKDFDSYNGVAPARLSGRILLKVEDLGKAYYVNPSDLKMYYLGRPLDAFNIMRNFGLGITTFNLSLMPISASSAIPPGDIMNIVLENPTQNQSIVLPLEINGQARVFEGTLNIRLKNSNNLTLVERFTTSQALEMGEYGPFSVSLVYPEPMTRYGTLEVFSISPKDGSEIDKIIANVVFLDIETQSVKLFFGNSKLNQNLADCSKVYPVDRRIEKTLAVGSRSLEELILGPTIGELKNGYLTNINSSVAVNSLSINNGIAAVDFNEALDFGVAGSCMVLAIRSQISETLKQFPSVDTVIISVNGETEGILQP